MVRQGRRIQTAWGAGSSNEPTLGCNRGYCQVCQDEDEGLEGKQHQSLQRGCELAKDNRC